MNIQNKKVLIYIESNTSGTGEIFLTRTILLGYYPILIIQNKGKYEFLKKINTNILSYKIQTHLKM